MLFCKMFALFEFIVEEVQFRSLIVWIEDQHIRHYTIEDRESLRQINQDTWEETFCKVSFRCVHF